MSSITSFVNHPFFGTRYKLQVHIVELILVVAVLAISGARLTLPGLPRTRANTITLGFGAKSLIFIGYQVLTEHVAALHRWASLKANAILNGLEILFWSAAAFLVTQANIAICIGTGCTLSWVIVGLSIVLAKLSFYAFIVSLGAFKRAKAAKNAISPPTQDLDASYPMQDVSQGSNYVSKNSKYEPIRK